MNNIYDSYENIKLLELHPNQNKEYHPSLNYGYDGLDITNNFDHKIYDFLFKDYKDRFISIGNESIGETIKDWLIKFWKWLKEKLIKFKNWIINLIKKSIDYLKRLLFRFQSENNNIKHTLSHISKESIKRRNKEILNDLITYVNNNIINKKGLEDYPNKENLKLIPLQDTEALIKLSKDIQNEQTIIKILYPHIEKLASTLSIDESSNINHSTLNINIFEYAKNNGVLNLDRYNLSDTTKNYLYGKGDLISKNSDQQEIIKTILGNELLTLLNNPSYDTILKLIQKLNNYIKLLQNNYEKFINDNYKESAFILINKISKTVNDKLQKDYPDLFEDKDTDKLLLNNNQIVNNRLNILFNLINDFIENLYFSIPVLFARNVIIIMPFLNYFLRSIVEKYNYTVNPNKINLIFSENDKKLKELRNVSIYRKIEEINVYKVSDIINDCFKNTDIYDDAVYVAKLNNELIAQICIYGMDTYPLIMISDTLIDYLKNDDFIAVVLYHEYGHYYYNHAANRFKEVLTNLLNGKPYTLINYSIEKELQADLYTINRTSPKIVKETLQKINKHPSYINNKGLQKRIEFCKQYEINSNITIGEFLNLSK